MQLKVETSKVISYIIMASDLLLQGSNTVNAFTMNLTHPIIYTPNISSLHPNQAIACDVLEQIGGSIAVSLGAAGLVAITGADQSLQWRSLLPFADMDKDSGRAIVQFINSTTYYFLPLPNFDQFIDIYCPSAVPSTLQLL